MRNCNRCHEDKDVAEDFYPDSPYGNPQLWCIACCRAKAEAKRRDRALLDATYPRMDTTT